MGQQGLALINGRVRGIADHKAGIPLHAAQKLAGHPLVLKKEQIPGDHLDHKMKYLVDIGAAFVHGAQAVIPVDADVRPVQAGPRQPGVFRGVLDDEGVQIILAVGGVGEQDAPSGMGGEQFGKEIPQLLEQAVVLEMVRVKLVVSRKRVLQGGDLKDGEGRIGVEFQQLDGQTGKPARKVEAAQHVRMPDVLAVSALDDRHGIIRYAQFVQTP